MCTVVSYSSVCGAIIDKMLADGTEEDIERVLSELGRHVSVAESDTDTEDEVGI